MLMLSSIAIDPTLSVGGVWAPYMGGEFLLARKGSSYNARLAELYNENRAELEQRNEDQTLTPHAAAKMQEIYTIAFCEHCLLDWRNVGEKDQGAIAYSPELATKLLLDPRYAELAQYLESYSLNHMHYRSVAEQEVAKVVKSSAVS